MTASAPGAAIPASAARTLGTIPPEIVPAAMRASASAAVSGRDLLPVRAADPVDVGHQHELARAQPGGQPGRRVVRVDVADDALLVARERGDDRHLARDEERVEEVALDPDDVGDEAHPGDALAEEEAAVDAGQADRVDAQVAQRGHQLRVDDAAQHRRGDLEGLRVGDAEAALEARRDAEPVEPLGHPLAAAVDDDDGPPPGDRGHLGEDLLLVGEGRPAELEDEDLAHVVYSAFSITYCSVRSQPKASPLPAPRPRSRRTRTSGASIAAPAAVRSKAAGPPAGPS